MASLQAISLPHLLRLNRLQNLDLFEAKHSGQVLALQFRVLPDGFAPTPRPYHPFPHPSLLVMKIHDDLPAEDVQIQIIPLIDVIFCILTFFILAALQFTRQQAINVELPRASTGTALSIPGLGDNRFREMLVVTIAPTGQLYLDQRPVDRSQLYQELQTYVSRNPRGMLVLNASPSVFYNDVIQVVDLMRSVGGDRVALATLPAASPTPGGTPLQPGNNPVPAPTATFDPFAPFNGSPSPGAIPGATISPLAPNPKPTTP